MKKIFTILIPLTLLLYISLGWFMSGIVLAEDSASTQDQINGLNNDWILSHDQILAEMGQPERFKIQSVGDVQIIGDYFQNTDTIDCGVVISHGHGSGKTAMLKYADLFWDCGCDVVIYDHRAHGESGSAAPTAGIRESVDHINVTNWLKNKTGLQNHQIGWMGASWGAATVLIAGAEDSEMAFIAADSPYQDWYTAIYERGKRMYGGMIDVMSPIAMAIVNMRARINYEDANPLEAVKSVTEPIFLIHSMTDEGTASSQSVNIAKHLNAKSEFHHTEWGAAHCRDINTRPEEYRALFYAFLSEKVGSFGLCGK